MGKCETRKKNYLLESFQWSLFVTCVMYYWPVRYEQITGNTVLRTTSLFTGNDSALSWGRRDDKTRIFLSPGQLLADSSSVDNLIGRNDKRHETVMLRRVASTFAACCLLILPCMLYSDHQWCQFGLTQHPVYHTAFRTSSSLLLHPGCRSSDVLNPCIVK